MFSKIIPNGKTDPAIAKKEWCSVLAALGVYPSNVL
jgi:hypothetical protein